MNEQGIQGKGKSKIPRSTKKTNEFSEAIQVNRDFIAGDQINISQTIKMPALHTPANLEGQRASYLTHLSNSYRALDFKGIPQLETFTREMLLEDVYVPLLARPQCPEGETWLRPRLAGRKLQQDDLPKQMLAGMKGETIAPVKVEEALAKHKRVVVLGDPGSGKSTLLKYMALRLAAESNAPLPILMPLNAYAAALENGQDISLQRFLPDYYAARCVQTENLGMLFDLAINQGQAVVLLDGLHEVQTRNRRILIERVEFFAQYAAEKQNRVVVTSRIVGYNESPLTGRDWQLYTLLDFDRDAIENFAARWCLAFEKGSLGNTPESVASAERERRSLLNALDANPGVAQLASNPLLLTILALIKRQGVSLPNRRVELYELYLKTLISAWGKARALDKRPVGPEIDYRETMAVLALLALWLREENPTAGLVKEEELLEWLTDFYQGEDYGCKRDEAQRRSKEFLDSVHRYSNLLVERGNARYGFLHLTFEEMLAACGLVSKGQLNLDDALTEIRRHLTEPAWRETILLAVGVWGVVREQSRAAAEVVRAILAADCTGEDICKNVLLAGACLEDVGESGLGRKAADEVQCALLAACQNSSLPPEVRRDAGFSLGRSGWQPDDLDEMVLIPAGEFLYGDENDKKTITEPFLIGKYPVTNLQYRRFVEAGGYEDSEYWSEEGWAWRTGKYDSQAPDEIKKWLFRRTVDQRTEPFFWRDPKWNNALAPVVGVCWFEAQAYTRWLSKAKEKTYSLPSEEQWERAARGVNGRVYAWGNQWDPARLNCAEFWAEQKDISMDMDWEKCFIKDPVVLAKAGTSAVCQFPTGCTPDGIHDLSGNVWEWTASWFNDNNLFRMVCGSSWFNDRSYACCVFRIRYDTDDFSDLVGFRILSPGSVSES